MSDMAEERTAKFDGLDDLIRDLDRKGRVLVEQVTRNRNGEMERELWIARIGKPDHRLKTVDPDLFGPVIVSEELRRGPLPNAWSHHNRLQTNREMTLKAASSAGRYLEGSGLVSRVIGIAVTLLLLSAVATCIYQAATAPEPEGYRVVQ